MAQTGTNWDLSARRTPITKLTAETHTTVDGIITGGAHPDMSLPEKCWRQQQQVSERQRFCFTV